MIIKGKFASRCGAANNQSRSVDRHQTRHWKFAARSEKLGHGQQSLLDETIYADLAAIELELERLSLQPKAKDAPNKPRRTPFPANLPRADVHHEPELTLCDCGCELKRIGEDISEKLDYTPGVFTVERHVRGKWVCGQCETLTQAPVPAHVIDKGVRTAGLLAHVLVSKHGDHLPLYRQERILAGSARAGRRQAAVMGSSSRRSLMGTIPMSICKTF